ncbi:MAG TPA: hypothetical protein VGN26_03250 [Armatimonadota bacterium]
MVDTDWSHLRMRELPAPSTNLLLGRRRFGRPSSRLATLAAWVGRLLGR